MTQFRVATLMAIIAVAAYLCFLHQLSASTTHFTYPRQPVSANAAVDSIDLQLHPDAHLGEPIEIVTAREEDFRGTRASDDDDDYVRPAWAPFCILVLVNVYLWCDSFT